MYYKKSVGKLNCKHDDKILLGKPLKDHQNSKKLIIWRHGVWKVEIEINENYTHLLLKHFRQQKSYRC